MSSKPSILDIARSPSRSDRSDLEYGRLPVVSWVELVCVGLTSRGLQSRACVRWLRLGVSGHVGVDARLPWPDVFDLYFLEVMGG